MCAVEWKSLEELGVFYGGLSGKSKDDFQDGNAKFVTYMNVYSNMSLDFTIADMVKVGEYEKQNSIKYGDILFTGSSETPDDCGMSCVVTNHINEPIYLNSFCFGFRFYEVEKFEPNFLKHYFRCIAIRKAISLTASGVTRFNVSKKRFGKIQIPLLVVSKQQEIVSQLDTFTTLISNLESELDMRRKQYEHYRNQLLNFEGVELKTLDEIADIVVGFPFDSSKFVEKGIRLMRGMNIKRGYLDFDDNLNKYWNTVEGLEKYDLNTNDIVISMDGSLVGRSFALIEQKHLPLLLVQRVARIRTNYNVKYIYFNICMSFPDYVDKKKTAGAIPHISMKDIQKFSIPFPSLAKQQQIVEKLDAFEQLIQSLEQEIKLRKQQYEYYREKLLTFE